MFAHSVSDYSLKETSISYGEALESRLSQFREGLYAHYLDLEKNQAALFSIDQHIRHLLHRRHGVPLSPSLNSQYATDPGVPPRSSPPGHSLEDL